MIEAHQVRALSGGPLYGSEAVRYVFVDEAGISALEPVTVVVAIIAHADKHVMDADNAVAEIMGGVPARYRDTLIPHATTIFSDEKYRQGWSQTDRLKVLSKLMSLPRRMGLAMSIGVQWRGTANGFDGDKLRQEQRDHLEAFARCIAMADRGIRDHAGLREVATVVAEDVPEMRQRISGLPAFIRSNPLFTPPEHLRQTTHDAEAGHTLQNGDLRITRIRRGVHFVAKPDEPLVQVADACAFGFRRYFAGETFGKEFVTSILGQPEAVAHFASPCGGDVYWPNHEVDVSAWPQAVV